MVVFLYFTLTACQPFLGSNWERSTESASTEHFQDRPEILQTNRIIYNALKPHLSGMEIPALNESYQIEAGPSSDFANDQIDAEIFIVDTGSATIGFLELANVDGHPISINSADQWTISDDDYTRSLTENWQLIEPLNSEEGASIEFAPGNAGISTHSTFFMPPEFEILQPVQGADFSLNDILTVEWSLDYPLSYAYIIFDSECKIESANDEEAVNYFYPYGLSQSDASGLRSYELSQIFLYNLFLDELPQEGCELEITVVIHMKNAIGGAFSDSSYLHSVQLRRISVNVR